MARRLNSLLEAVDLIADPASELYRSGELKLFLDKPYLDVKPPRKLGVTIMPVQASLSEGPELVDIVLALPVSVAVVAGAPPWSGSPLSPADAARHFWRITPQGILWGYDLLAAFYPDLAAPTVHPALRGDHPTYYLKETRLERDGRPPKLFLRHLVVSHPGTLLPDVRGAYREDLGRFFTHLGLGRETPFSYRTLVAASTAYRKAQQPL